jgi:hypothetical protein
VRGTIPSGSVNEREASQCLPDLTVYSMMGQPYRVGEIGTNMGTDIGTVILAGALPLVGVILGAGATISVQRSSTQASRLRFVAESRQAYRAEVKSSIVLYLEVMQQLQTNLDAREHGEEVADLGKMMEHVWLAYKQTAIICSDQLRVPLLEHSRALQMAVRGKGSPDWWA